MNLSDARRIRVPRPQRKRVGRGWGSGLGKTSTRGEKGAGRRSGTRFRLRFEGGQMPLYRRLPKKGFSNARYRVTYSVVNVGDLERAFSAGAKVDLEALRAAHLVPKNAARLKILGDGEVTKGLQVTADAASAGARKKIEAAGGTLALPQAWLDRAARAEAEAKAAAEAEAKRAEAVAKAREEARAAAAAKPAKKKEKEKEKGKGKEKGAPGGEPSAAGPEGKDEAKAKAKKPPKGTPGGKGGGAE
jgi:large subunit ribosomal protein L15